jgi:hypothetical protein
MPYSLMVANAQRIVSCVNACAGIPTEDLGSLKGSYNFFKTISDHVKKSGLEALAQFKGVMVPEISWKEPGTPEGGSDA